MFFSAILIDRGIFIIFFVAFWDSILYSPETMQLIIFYVILLIEIAIKSKRKTEVTIMEFKSILIKDTTVEERKQIVKESLGNISASCDGCMARLSKKRSVTLIWNLMDTIYVETWTKEKKEAVRCKSMFLCTFTQSLMKRRCSE